MRRAPAALAFEVGGNFVDFERYYTTAGLPWITRAPSGRVGNVEKEHILNNPEHLIVCKEGNKAIGHMIWHGSNTEEHAEGGRARGRVDKTILRRLLGRGEEFVELHESWLIRGRRRKGYGRLFFAFFSARSTRENPST